MLEFQIIFAELNVIYCIVISVVIVQMVKKANGELVDFDEVRPKIKVMPKAISSYANAVADAVWGLKSLATKHLSFYVVQSGDNISQRLPRSQVDVLKSEFFLVIFTYFILHTAYNCIRPLIYV